VNKAREQNLLFMDGHIDGAYMYFSARNFNGLFRIAIGTDTAEFLGHFKEEEILKKNLHRQVVCINNQLYFIPYTGKGISIYDKAANTFSFAGMEGQEVFFISRAYAINSDILMIPSDISVPFVMFHTDNRSFEIMEKLKRQFDDVYRQNQEKDIRGLYSSCIAENMLFICGDYGVIFCITLDEWKVQVYHLPKKYKIRNMYFDRQEIYFTLSDRCWVIRWDYNTNKCYEYKITDTNTTCFHSYMTIFRWRTHLILLPDRMEEILELDEEKDEWRIGKEYIPTGFFRRKTSGSLFIGYQFVEGKLLLLPWSGNGMIILSEDRAKICEVICSVEVFEKVIEMQKSLMKTKIIQKNVIYEDDETASNLEQMVEAFMDIGNKNVNMKSIEIGEKIWKLCNS
jgi:hypothetical protein